MSEQLPLSFRVQCTACYGTEVWHFGRILRSLIAAGIPLSPDESDIEFVAEQFVAYSKQICCPACEKIGMIAVHRIEAVSVKR